MIHCIPFWEPWPSEHEHTRDPIRIEPWEYGFTLPEWWFDHVEDGGESG